MIGENNRSRGQLRGYMFEVIIRKLLELNSFKVQSISEVNSVKVHNKYDIEIKGRGTWHQIDTPCIYKKDIPFVHNLRLLAEVKFLRNEVQKDKIRQYIGVIKDISENYFIDQTHTTENQKRYTDVGAFFAANGFQKEADNLAFAHNIKTISYKNNKLIDKFKFLIMQLEKNYFRAKDCISKGNRLRFMNALNDYLSGIDDQFSFHVSTAIIGVNGGYEDYLGMIYASINRIKSSFIGVTSTNYFLHFLSEAEFPKYLFSETDEAECRVFYNRGSRQFYLTINGDNDNSQFHFSAPKNLLSNVFILDQEMYGEKIRHFGKITVAIELGELHRNLVLKIDKEWLKKIGWKGKPNQSD